MFPATRLCFLTLLSLALADPLPDSLSIYPKVNRIRQVNSLDGVWNFKISNYSVDARIGFKQRWFEKPLNHLAGEVYRMPVPASFNDISEKRELRDYSGWAWYDREFSIPDLWLARLAHSILVLRFDSVNYEANVFVNGKPVGNHTGGHLPFQLDITDVASEGRNRITVAVNNQLTANTLPQGGTRFLNDSRIHGAKFAEVSTVFDFFNYAGIQRPVQLVLLPKVRIIDVTIVTDVDGTSGLVDYEAVINDRQDGYRFEVHLTDAQDRLVAQESNFKSKFNLSNANLWWPFTMSEKPGYQYRLTFDLYSGNKLIDSYQQLFGIRTVKVTNQQVLVNGKPFYFRGFGKHEEYNVRGRAFDQTMIMKDFSLIKWTGANSFRTSHYPYSEQLMDEADSQGIVVIDECPAVALQSFNDQLLELHRTVLRELIDRDKNRPSVFLWSLANEPKSADPKSLDYFQKVSSYARSLDRSQRPLTGAISAEFNNCHMAPSLDLLMINRYYAWYSDAGYPQVIRDKLIHNLQSWFEQHNKPVMVSEYGADSISGMHTTPSFIFSEDYQVELMLEYFGAFDSLKSKGFFVGEHIWNFADFMTNQAIVRVGGNKKGIFTREREPKSSARILRCRYWKLASINYVDQNQQGLSYCPRVQY